MNSLQHSRIALLATGLIAATFAIPPVFADENQTPTRMDPSLVKVNARPALLYTPFKVGDFRDPKTGKVLVDVMKTNQPLYHAIFKHSRAITSEGQEFLIPSLEMALAMKFAPMISLNRQDEDKLQDAHDFIRM